MQSGATLTSWATGASYKWLDCNNGYAAVPGATSQTFKPTANGTYAVEVSNSSCTDTSSCYTIANVGLEELLTNTNVEIYPNPASNNVSIKFNKTVRNLDVELLNSAGQIVESYVFDNTRQADVILNVPTGVYIVKISAENSIVFKKLVIK